MSDPLRSHQDESEDRQGNLKPLRPQLLRRDWLDSPLRGWSGAQAANAPDDVQVEQGAECRSDHHGDAYGVSVESGGWSVNAKGRLGQRAEADGNPHSADRDDGGAGALQDDKDETRHADEPRLAWCTLGQGRGRILRTDLRDHQLSTL